MTAEQLADDISAEITSQAWLLVVVYVAQVTTDLSWVQLAQAAWTAVQP